MPARRKRSPQDSTIIGIDPGVAIVGYTVVRVIGSALTPLACDVIRTPAKIPLEARLQLIWAGGPVASYLPSN